MKSSKRRRSASWCTGGHGVRQERSQFCFHSQPSTLLFLLVCLLLHNFLFLFLPPSQQTFSVSCCFFTNHNLLLFLLAYLLLHHLLLILAKILSTRSTSNLLVTTTSDWCKIPNILTLPRLKNIHNWSKKLPYIYQGGNMGPFYSHHH